MRTGAVIVAAGRENELQLLAKDGELTMAERIVISFQRVGIKDIVMVTGYQAERLEKSLQRHGITFLRNDAYEQSHMIDSAKIGLSYLQDCCKRILFCPVDVPFFKVETLQKLLEQGGELVVPVCGEKTGHPVCIRSSLVSAVLTYNGQRGVKGALYEAGYQAVKIPVDDIGIFSKAETLKEYQELVDYYNAVLMHPNVKVRLVKQRPFFGPGTATLLRQIERIGSVREACVKTGISYSKSWTIIHTAEEELGYKIVERVTGGKYGGEAYVTARGKKLLELYEQYEKQVEQAASSIFEEIFLESDLF